MNAKNWTSPSYLWERRGRFGTKLVDIGRQSLRQIGIPTSPSDRKIRSLRNIHSGKRAFILGNGPSLKLADLSRLEGEITFASNKIYLAFNEIKWRPTYYFVTDRLVAMNNNEIIRGLPLEKFLSDEVRHYFPGKSDITWLHELWRNGVVLDRAEGRPTSCDGYFSEDAMVGVDAGGTVMYCQLQMAYYMGVSEVYLIGADFHFDLPSKRVATGERGYGSALESQGEVNHFHRDYRKPGEIWAIPRLDVMLLTYELARKHYEKAGRRILNASRQTKLEVFPRVDFDRVLPPAASSGD